MGDHGKHQWRAVGAIVAILAFGVAPEAAAQACTQPVATFKALAQKLEALDEAQGATVLNAELLEHATERCKAFWIVEILSAEGDVTVIALQARTLEVWPGDAEMLLDTLELDEEDETYPRPIAIMLMGTDQSDFLEGSWTDDTSTGGAARDLFFVTPGRDVIRDFKPGEDVLAFDDFVRAKDGFGTLRSLAALRQASSQQAHEGRPALVIDLDGAAGDWALILPGISLAELDHRSVSFDEDDPVRARLDAEFFVGRQVTASDGTIVFFPGHLADERPDAPILLQGDKATMEILIDLLGP